LYTFDYTSLPGFLEDEKNRKNLKFSSRRMVAHARFYGQRCAIVRRVKMPLRDPGLFFALLASARLYSSNG